MNAKRLLFRASKTPNPREVHCLWAHLTDKQFQNQTVDMRIELNNRLVSVITPLDLAHKSVALEQIRFEFIRATSEPEWSYPIGAFVRVSGSLCYSVHKHGSRKDVCPVDYRGEIKKGFRQGFLAYLEEQTGLDFTSEAVADLDFARVDLSIPAEKVWLNDVISFSVLTSVKDAGRLNSLSARAIGRRRAYGQGNVYVTSSA